MDFSDFFLCETVIGVSGYLCQGGPKDGFLLLIPQNGFITLFAMSSRTEVFIIVTYFYVNV